jgi:phosphatidylserine/phosphatidylglycerophosphate/cardiolipin synthase-like enzyme
VEKANLKPLINGQDVFPALEEAVLQSHHACYFSFRLFDMSTRLMNPKSKALDLSTWSDLIGYHLEQKKHFYLMVSDFDLLGAPDEHAQCTQTTQQAEKFFNHDCFHILPALHPSTPRKPIRYTLWPWLWYELHKKYKKASSQERQLPGFQNHSGKNGIRFWPPYRPTPATYHQKMAIFDPHTEKAVLILGGLDITERLYDDKNHQRVAEQTWHDTDIRIIAQKGQPLDVIQKAYQHFCEGWNRQCKAIRKNAYLRERFHAHCRKQCPLPQTLDYEAPTSFGQVLKKNNALSEPVFLRTRSKQSKSFFSIGPENSFRELLQGHCHIIEKAQNLLYIESQFLRDENIANALIKAAEEKPNLFVILLLPAVPEEVVFKNKHGLAMRYGEWLQINALNGLKKAFGERLGVFCLADNERKKEQYHKERYTIEKREIVYVHSKVMIADNDQAIVSSANLNGRSMNWDEEAGVLWADQNSVLALKEKLWSAHMKRPADELLYKNPAEILSLWNALAKEKNPTSFIAEYPLNRASKFSKWFGLIPKNML